MHRHRTPRFFAAVSLGSLTFALGAQVALADTTVGGNSTTPVLTSTGGNVTVASGGTITLVNGSAVTVDSSNTATVASGGTIAMGAGNGATGITVNPGTTTTISNAGAINVTENYTAPFITNNGVNIADGPIAAASNRYGIHVLSGGTVTGSVTNSGTISVEGLNSAGIALDSTLNGNLGNTGTISVKGDNSAGIRTSAVTGNVTAGGTVTAIGQGAQALVTSGDIGGTLKINGTLGQATTYTADDGTSQVLSRTALQSGAAAVEVDGNVAGGVLIAAPNSSTSTETTGSIQSYGSSPGLQIGGANNIAIGTVASNDGTYSVAVDGSVTANAYYSSTNAYGIVIGGKGGNVNLAGGIGINGNVTATTNDANATAILINQGSTVPTLYVSGTVKAASTSLGISAYAVRDLSGTLTTVNNTGFITSNQGSQSGAIDLSANTSGVTVKQYLNATDAASQKTDKAAAGYNVDTATVYAAITGNIYTGSGNDTLDVETGKITGNTFLGAGNDTVIMADDSKYIGNIDFGTGTATMTMGGNSRFTGTLIFNDQPATLTLNDSSIWRGTVTGGSQATVNVNSGLFAANATGNIAVNSLNVGANGTLGVYVDGTTGTSSTFVTNTATFASGSKITASLTSIAKAEGTYTVLTSNGLTGASNLSASNLALPVLYAGTLATQGNNLQLTIARKTAAQLGLTAAQGAIYNPIIAQAQALTAAGGTPSALETDLLQVADTPTLQAQFNQLMPDYAGGVFDFVTRGSRLAAQHVQDDSSLFTISNVGGWFEPIYFHGGKQTTGTAGFSDHGFGLSGGLERVTGIGNVGLSLTWISGKVNTSSYQSVKTSNLEVGAFWRMAKGPFYAFARVGGSRLSATSARTFTGAVSGTSFNYTAAGKWKGWMITGSGGASYGFDVGGNFQLRPKAIVEYYRLHENAYDETGSAPIILEVAGRNSSALTGTTTLVASWSSGPSSYEGRPFTVEVEGGRRNQLSGHLGTTLANFTDGNQFALTPDSLKSAWLGKVSILQGGLDYTWRLTGGAERAQGVVDYSIRASLSIAL
ncbi:beta strand repeat-containing protein [Novosphingobium sp. UBA1939]|uniref:beta strand repeat-containing protein n=1 Tax=Novosphingobium sp. UBA1939 TaxID=1946982 RepID=UPI0025D5235C|nr:autotransporter domain-containing protein [Novosphingobium sp. UBA1939]